MESLLEEKENGVQIRGGGISLWPQKQHFLAEGRMGTMMQRNVILFFGGGWQAGGGEEQGDWSEKAWSIEEVS